MKDFDFEIPDISFKPSKLGWAVIIGLPVIAGLVYFYKKNHKKVNQTATGNNSWFNLPEVGTSFGERVKTLTEKFRGEKEVPENKGFVNAEFAAKMREAGFKTGDSWCAIYAKLIWLNALSGAAKDRANDLMSASTITTFNSLKSDNSGFFKYSNTPKVGALATWQYDNTQSGHSGIYIGQSSNGSLLFSEGNMGNAVKNVEVTNVHQRASGDSRKMRFLGYIYINE